MRDRTLFVVWGVGIALAAAVYAVGPDQFLERLFLEADRLADNLQFALLTLGARAYDVVRALAIACFAVFFALSVVAAGRGLPARWLLVGVTLLFLMLVWHEGPEAITHWLLAFVLAATGAASMTRRLAERRPMMPPPLPPRGEERF